MGMLVLRQPAVGRWRWWRCQGLVTATTIITTTTATVIVSLRRLPSSTSPPLTTHNHHRRRVFSFSSTTSPPNHSSLTTADHTLSHHHLQQQQQQEQQHHEDKKEEGEPSSKAGPLKSGLYLVATPIGNLEDITLRALRVLRSADVILSEDTRHSGKLLQHYNIKTPLLSYHKFNESQREDTVLRKLQQGNIVALISDAGTPGISDPGTELAKLCVNEKIPVIPIPGPSAFVTALSASGLATEEFTFVGFLPKHAGSRRKRLLISSKETVTQIFFVPPHKLLQFLEETSSLFSDSRRCVIAREMTKLHEEFWRGTLGEAKEVFFTRQPKGEITVLIEGKANSIAETPSEAQLEHELRNLISSGHSLSMAVKLVSEGTSVKRKTIYSLALKKFGKQAEAEDDSN